SLVKLDHRQVWKEWREVIFLSVKRKLRGPPPKPEDDRSKVIWKVENVLLELGLRPEEVLCVCRESPWNKFGRSRRGEGYLWKDICKCARAKGIEIEET
ncbi:MAG TPA: hypothetical protein VHR88_05710, partial [Solirubrobacteraceae bacterium]|nr:hypothetical protein [Solirubrobacteraceae bacterium]